MLKIFQGTHQVRLFERKIGHLRFVHRKKTMKMNFSRTKLPSRIRKFISTPTSSQVKLLSDSDALMMRKKYLSPSLGTFQAFEKSFHPVMSYGQYLFDTDGKQYLDCLAQNLTISVGHQNEHVLNKTLEQQRMMTHCTTMYANDSPIIAAQKIVQTLPQPEDYVIHFVNSGSEAVDLALLMSRMYTGNWDLLSLQNSYHGLQGPAMGATGMSVCKQQLPHQFGINHVPHPVSTGLFSDTTLSNEEQIRLYLKAFEETINYQTPGSIAGFIFEQVQGYGGIHVLPPEYVRQAAKLTKAAGGLVIADEVQSGFGRVSTPDKPVYWSFELSDIVPDIVVTAKGLGNGYPIAAVMVKRKIAESIVDRQFFNTYGGNPTVCAAAQGVLDITTDPRFEDYILSIGPELGLALELVSERFPHIVKELRGQGLMYGMELQPSLAKRAFEMCRDNGVIFGLGGYHKNVLRVMPPMCIDPEDVEHIFNVLCRVFKTISK